MNRNLPVSTIDMSAEKDSLNSGSTIEMSKKLLDEFRAKVGGWFCWECSQGHWGKDDKEGSQDREACNEQERVGLYVLQCQQSSTIEMLKKLLDEFHAKVGHCQKEEMNSKHALRCQAGSVPKGGDELQARTQHCPTGPGWFHWDYEQGHWGKDDREGNQDREACNEQERVGLYNWDVEEAEFRAKLGQCQKEEMNSKHAHNIVQQDLVDSNEKANKNIEEKTTEGNQDREACNEQETVGLYNWDVEETAKLGPCQKEEMNSKHAYNIVQQDLPGWFHWEYEQGHRGKDDREGNQDREACNEQERVGFYNWDVEETAKLGSCQKEEMNSKHAYNIVQQDLVDSTENTNKDIEEKTTEKETRTEKRAMNKKELASTIGDVEEAVGWVPCQAWSMPKGGDELQARIQHGPTGPCWFNKDIKEKTKEK